MAARPDSYDHGSQADGVSSDVGRGGAGTQGLVNGPHAGARRRGAAASWIRVTGMGLALLLGAALLGAGLSTADADRHPYFDDEGTLDWHRGYSSAESAARAQNKLIFVEYGRKYCVQCRVLCMRTLPDPLCKGLASASCVGLVAEADAPETRIERLFDRHLPRARSLPLVAILDKDGNWLDGWSGRCSAERLEQRLHAARKLAGLPRYEPPSTSHAIAGPLPVRRSLEIHWHKTLSDAQAKALREGKLLLCVSDQRACTACRRFIEKVVTPNGVAAESVAIGYLYNIRNPERVSVDRTLRKNLRGAKRMPLVGFLDPADLSWVHGFWGFRTSDEFERDLEKMALWLHKRQKDAPQKRAAAEQPPAPPLADHTRDLDEATGDCEAGRCEGGVCRVPERGLPQGIVGTPLVATAPEARSAAEPTPTSAPDSATPDVTQALPEAPGPANLAPASAPRVASAGRPRQTPDRLAVVGTGSPDEVVLPASGTRRVRAGSPTDLPPPIVRVASAPRVVRAPERSTSSQRAARPQADEAEDATSQARRALLAKVEVAIDGGAWAEVLALADGVPGLERAVEAAHRHANDQLGAALTAMQQGDRAGARKLLDEIADDFTGHPAGVDAVRGLQALERVADLAVLRSDSPLTKALRKNAFESMRGSRWARLFE